MSVEIKKSNYLFENPHICLITIGLVGLFIRLYFIPYDIPITLDGLFYFRYAIDTSILGHFPETELINNGWPTLLAFFFSIFTSNNFLDYMLVQRLLSIFLSVITIIPVYFLAKRFCEPKYSLMAAALFVFDPKIIQNSLLGITEPLYIIIVTLSLVFILSRKQNLIYFSFVMSALAVQIRYEGILLLIVISIMYFILQRKEKKIIIKYFLAITIFFLVLFPMTYLRTITIGSDGISDGLTAGVMVYGLEASENKGDGLNGILSYVLTGFQALVKYFGWLMIPYFIFFVPFGILILFKKRNDKNLTLFLTLIILSIPGLYAYSRGIEDAKYLYVLIPIFSIISIFPIKFVEEKIKKIFLIIIIAIIISSTIFLTLKIDDYEYERESFEISKYISSYTDGVNKFPGSKYVRVTGMIEQFPILSNSVSYGPKMFDVDYMELHEFIEKNRIDGLEHIVAYNDKDTSKFVRDVFVNDKEYPYLTKVFDSEEFGFKHQIKMYKINYEIFDLMFENNSE